MNRKSLAKTFLLFLLFSNLFGSLPSYVACTDLEPDEVLDFSILSTTLKKPAQAKIILAEHSPTHRDIALAGAPRHHREYVPLLSSAGELNFNSPILRC